MFRGVCAVSKSFAGHRSGVISVEFHPMKGDFVASGSCDTNVKVWDLRRKTCLQSFKGHAKGVCCLAFSPDGKWIASGSEDGEVKVLYSVTWCWVIYVCVCVCDLILPMVP